MAGLKHIDSFDREFIDFSIEQWAMGIRARLLIKSGCMDDAKLCLAQMLAADTPATDPVIRQITHHLHVELAAMIQDAQHASHHAGVVSALLVQSPSPYSKGFTFWCVGVANESIGNLAFAQSNFSEALTCIAQTKVGAEFEAEINAGLAECQYKLGNFDQALIVAQENLTATQSRSNRVAECRARLVCSQVLARGDVQARQEALTHLVRAEQLVMQTGARAYEYALRNAQAILRQ